MAEDGLITKKRNNDAAFNEASSEESPDKKQKIDMWVAGQYLMTDHFLL